MTKSEKSFSKISKLSLVSCIALGLFSASSATAADLGGDAPKSYKDDYDTKTTKVKIGGGVLVVPEYEGSGDYQVLGFPIIGFGDGESRITVDGIDSIKYALIKNNGFELGPLAGYRFGRDQDDGRLLDGLGDVDGGVVVGGYAKYWFTPNFYTSASFHHQVGGDDTGYEIKLHAGTEHTLSNNWKFMTSIGATYSSEDYMQSFFGVTSAQSAASTAGLAAYNADAGFKSVEASLGLNIPLSERWEARVKGTYTHLLDEAADSPVVEEESQFSAMFGLVYTFDWTR